MLSGPFLRQVGCFAPVLGSFLRLSGDILCLVGPFPRPLSCPPQLISAGLRVPDEAESFDIRSRDATCGSLARVALFRGFPGLLLRPASLRRLPSDAVGLARFGHAPPRSDLPGLVTRHGHLSWRVCPPSARRGVDLTGRPHASRRPLSYSPPRRGPTVTRKLAGGALPLPMTVTPRLRDAQDSRLIPWRLSATQQMPTAHQASSQRWRTAILL